MSWWSAEKEFGMSPRRRSRGNPGGIYPNNAYRGGHFNYVLGCEKVTNGSEPALARQYSAENAVRLLEQGICTALTLHNRSTLRTSVRLNFQLEGKHRGDLSRDPHLNCHTFEVHLRPSYGRSAGKKEMETVSTTKIVPCHAEGGSRMEKRKGHL